MSDTKRVIVTGATGMIGKVLCRRLQEQGYAVVVFTRNPETARKAVPGAAEYIAWSPAESGPWASAVDGAHAIFSLAGASIAGQRWTDAYKRELRDSRIIATRGLVRAIEQSANKPQTLISASGVNYYGPHGDEKLDETAPPGNDFLARLCVEWEQAALNAEALGVRVVNVRTGIVLDKDEGALERLLLPFKFFVGGPILPGTQWMSWIHLADHIGILMRALEDDNVRGPINATAPEPMRNRDFTAAVGRALNRPAVVPVPGFALQMMFGELADALLLNGQRVIPARMQSLGYQFQFPQLDGALRDVLEHR
jgi:uncharacterized protein (TIGR01777 family)